MYPHIKIYLLALSLLTVGLTINSHAEAGETLLPVAEHPDACAMGRAATMPCTRWYSLANKPDPDACLDRPGQQPCRRWFVAPKPPELIAMRDVYFNTDSSKIRPSSYPTLNREAAKIKKQRQAKVEIIGNTDSTGPKAYNQKLSEARANAVMEYFIQQGISPSRLATTGVGDNNPVADNSTPAGRAQNRRTEMILE